MMMCMPGSNDTNKGGVYSKVDPPENTTVNVTMCVTDINKIDSINQVVGLELALILEWRDERIIWKKTPKTGGEWLLDTDLME